MNNAAAALVLALNATAEGKEVLISRGELIEIGGSFRIPDILRKSGAILREVGTTNRTHLQDYRDALSGAAGAILTVHRSNFEQTGFVASPETEALAALAAGSGNSLPARRGERIARRSPPGAQRGAPGPDAVRRGAGLVLFSGDKLLGGPRQDAWSGVGR